MKFLQMGKDMKKKHSVTSPPTKYWGVFSAKKLCMGEQMFLEKYLLHTMRLGLGFHGKSVFFFKNFLVATWSLMS